MRLATVRRTSFLLRSISTFEIESILAPRKYGVTWARASAESRFETNSAEQRILAVPATRQLSGSLGGNPGCATSGAATSATATVARSVMFIRRDDGRPPDRRPAPHDPQRGSGQRLATIGADVPT